MKEIIPRVRSITTTQLFDPICTKYLKQILLFTYRITGYQMPRSVKNWPAIGRVDYGEFPDQAPFVDANNNGCYDPENGDYPSI